LVKELVSVGSKSTIRGKSCFQGEFVFTQYYPILVMVKVLKKQQEAMNQHCIILMLYQKALIDVDQKGYTLGLNM